MSKITLPNFLVIGAEKAGTTWIHDRLRHHPDVFMSSVKELHYFNREGASAENISNGTTKDLEWYASHFQGADEERAIGEATPRYLCDPSAPSRIQRQLPEVKLIACLRYPVDRAYSHYWMAKGKKHTSQDFEEIVDQRDSRFIERGRYGKQLAQYLSFFDRDQLLMLIHEEVFDAPSRSLNTICSFLDVDDTFFQGQSWVTEEVHPASTERSILLHRAIGAIATWMRHHKGARHVLNLLKRAGIAGGIKKMNKKTRDYPEMPTEVRKELDQYYASTVRRVENLVGRRIERWRERSTTEKPSPESSAVE